MLAECMRLPYLVSDIGRNSGHAGNQVRRESESSIQYFYEYEIIPQFQMGIIYRIKSRNYFLLGSFKCN